MIYTDSMAENMKVHSGKSYRPSNGTEGELFQAAYCKKCNHDNFDGETADGGCDVFVRAVTFDVADKNYPKEWIIASDGQPTCTAFAGENKSCPFCGSNNTREDLMYFDDSGEALGIECLNCDATARIEWWNKRHDSCS